jgi:hypothetical protein
VPFRYNAGELSEMADEQQQPSCGKLQETEQNERVPISIASRERFTDEWLDSA